jgi:N utilization substance protein B
MNAGRRAAPRRRARELALQGLYQRQVGGEEPSAIRAQWDADPGNAQVDRAFLDDLWRGVNADQEAMLGELSPHLDRPARELSPIERAILIIGAWELVHRLDTPYRVVINEAVELAKAYGGIDGHRFVNGVLDKLAGRVRAPEIAALGRERAAGRRH